MVSSRQDARERRKGHDSLGGFLSKLDLEEILPVTNLIPTQSLADDPSATICGYSSMGKQNKLLAKVLKGGSDKNIGFRELCNLLTSLGFEKRIRGDHHIFSREGIEEILNLQPKKSKAKAYQVKQVRNLIVKYSLGGSTDE
jgi:hypothetical protein